MSVGGNVERSMRILYVGNIPHEVAEGNLKELLLEYGVILNFRLFKSAVSQYAFCEYEVPEMVVRAIHSLSSYAIKGQALSVDIAAGNRSPEEIASLQEFVAIGARDMFQPTEVTEKAPEEITKAVASLPAEQMFELMKQMKMCIENNPQEARNLLLQNPQLAYALLQAQIIMRIVDPEVALKILERPISETAEPEAKSVDVRQTLPAVSIASTASTDSDKDMRQLPLPDYNIRTASLTKADNDMRQISGDTDLRGTAAPVDPRPFDPRFRPADPRAMQQPDPRMMQGPDPRMMQIPDQRNMPRVDPRAMNREPDPRDIQVSDPGMVQGGGMDPRMIPGPDPRSIMGGMHGPGPSPRVDPRSMHAVDPRVAPGQPGTAFGPRPVDPRSGYDPRTAGRAEDPRKQQTMRPPVSNPLADLAIPEDEEKAALIMQVLQLSDDQIAMLPPEQRQSILVLKEQIARSQML